MEHSSLALLFGALGASLVFYATRHFVSVHYADKHAYESEAQAAIADGYEKLFWLRMGCLILSLLAAGLWLLEPRPYFAGASVGIACLLLWKAFRLRRKVVKLVREETEKHLSFGAASAAAKDDVGKRQGKTA